MLSVAPGHRIAICGGAPLEYIPVSEFTAFKFENGSLVLRTRLEHGGIIITMFPLELSDDLKDYSHSTPEGCESLCRTLGGQQITREAALDACFPRTTSHLLGSGNPH